MIRNECFLTPLNYVFRSNQCCLFITPQNIFVSCVSTYTYTQLSLVDKNKILLCFFFFFCNLLFFFFIFCDHFHFGT